MRGRTLPLLLAAASLLACAPDLAGGLAADTAPLAARTSAIGEVLFGDRVEGARNVALLILGDAARAKALSELDSAAAEGNATRAEERLRAAIDACREVPRSAVVGLAGDIRMAFPEAMAENATLAKELDAIDARLALGELGPAMDRMHALRRYLGMGPWSERERPSPTAASTPSPRPSLAAATAKPTEAALATATATAKPTEAALATATATAKPTEAALATATATAKPTEPATATASPKPSPSPAATAGPQPTPPAGEAPEGAVAREDRLETARGLAPLLAGEARERLASLAKAAAADPGKDEPLAREVGLALASLPPEAMLKHIAAVRAPAAAALAERDEPALAGELAQADLLVKLKRPILALNRLHYVRRALGLPTWSSLPPGAPAATAPPARPPAPSASATAEPTMEAPEGEGAVERSDRLETARGLGRLLVGEARERIDGLAKAAEEDDSKDAQLERELTSAFPRVPREVLGQHLRAVRGSVAEALASRADPALAGELALADRLIEQGRPVIALNRLHRLRRVMGLKPWSSVEALAAQAPPARSVNASAQPNALGGQPPLPGPGGPGASPGPPGAGTPPGPAGPGAPVPGTAPRAPPPRAGAAAARLAIAELALEANRVDDLKARRALLDDVREAKDALAGGAPVRALAVVDAARERARAELAEQERRRTEESLRELGSLVATIRDAERRAALERALANATAGEGGNATGVREALGQDAARLLAEREKEEARAELEAVRSNLTAVRDARRRASLQKRADRAAQLIAAGQAALARRLVGSVAAEAGEALRAAPAAGGEALPLLGTQAPVRGGAEAEPADRPRAGAVAAGRGVAPAPQLREEVRSRLDALTARMRAARARERDLAAKLTLASPGRQRELRASLDALGARESAIGDLAAAGSRLERLEAIAAEVEAGIGRLEQQAPRIAGVRADAVRLRARTEVLDNATRVRSLLSKIRLHELDRIVEYLPPEAAAAEAGEGDALSLIEPSDDEVTSEIGSGRELEGKLDIALSAQVVEVEEANTTGREERSLFTMSVSARQDAEGVRLVKVIPKALAQNASELSFTVQPQVVEADPIVMWDLGDLSAGEEVQLAFSARGGRSPAVAAESEVLVLRSPDYAEPGAAPRGVLQASDELVEQVASREAEASLEDAAEEVATAGGGRGGDRAPLQEEPGFAVLVAVLVLVAAFLTGVVFKAGELHGAAAAAPPAREEGWVSGAARQPEWPGRTVQGYQWDPMYGGQYLERRRER